MIFFLFALYLIPALMTLLWYKKSKGPLYQIEYTDCAIAFFWPVVWVIAACVAIENWSKS